MSKDPRRNEIKTAPSPSLPSKPNISGGQPTAQGV